MKLSIAMSALIVAVFAIAGTIIYSTPRSGPPPPVVVNEPGPTAVVNQPEPASSTPARSPGVQTPKPAVRQTLPNLGWTFGDFARVFGRKEGFAVLPGVGGMNDPAGLAWTVDPQEGYAIEFTITVFVENANEARASIQLALIAEMLHTVAPEWTADEIFAFAVDASKKSARRGSDKTDASTRRGEQELWVFTTGKVVGNGTFVFIGVAAIDPDAPRTTSRR